MLELLLIPSLLGLGLAMDLFSGNDDDDQDDAPIEITLPDDVPDFFGTAAMEHVTGNALDNLMVGGEGNDLLGGLDGNDTLIGGEGNDRLFAGAGSDAAIGGPGDDRVFLSDGADRSMPEPGSDDDAGDDLIRGGAASDTILDGAGHNELYGDLGNDRLFAVDGLASDGSFDAAALGQTSDTLHGGYGDDLLVGDAGDVMTGGDGFDTFVIAAASEATGAPAILMDFDLRDDLFSVVLLDEPEEDPVIEFAHDPETDQLSAIVNGETVAILHDITEADIPFIQTMVISLPALMAGTAS